VLHPAPFVRARVVPNPSVDRAVLEVQSDVVVDLDVMITTTQGDVVQQDRVVLPSAGTYQVDLATQSLGAGVYTVHLRSGTRTTTTRMVIVR
jgi:hypothetical protein